MKHKFACLLAAVFLAACPALHAQNLVANPSFETGSFVDGGDGFMTVTQGATTTISNWTVVNSDLVWGINGNSNDIVAHSGTHFLDLEGTSLYDTPYGGVMQTLATTPGLFYHFSFYLGTQESHANDHGPISASATAGSLTQSFTFTPTGANTQWGLFGFDFMAASASTPISIIGTFTNDGAYIGLDDVSVVPTVPEPSAAAFLLGGIPVIGAVCCWRRARGIRRAA